MEKIKLPICNCHCCYLWQGQRLALGFDTFLCSIKVPKGWTANSPSLFGTKIRWEESRNWAITSQMASGDCFPHRPPSLPLPLCILTIISKIPLNETPSTSGSSTSLLYFMFAQLKTYSWGHPQVCQFQTSFSNIFTQSHWGTLHRSGNGERMTENGNEMVIWIACESRTLFLTNCVCFCRPL